MSPGPWAAGTDADLPLAYLANDRREALADGRALPEFATGAGLFADVSGFVTVSARLAEEYGPQRGAEELTRLLDRSMGAAIDEIARFAGSVVYFSGDAITCWFDGENAAARAAAAGAAAVRAIRTTGQFVTEAGQAIALDLKVAVAAGTVRRFVVGNPDIQLIDVLAGELLTELAAIEEVAVGGEVLIGDSARPQLLDVAALGQSRRVRGGFGPAWALEVPPTPAVRASGRREVALPEDVVRPWLLPVVYERLRAGRGEFVAELRWAVPVFIRFSGIDFDAPDAPTRLNRFVTLTQEVLSVHGGNVLQLTLGDKGAYLYGVFGSPQAHGDDPSRAAAAALDLQQAAQAAGVTDVQVGMTFGRVRSGTYGHRWRRTFVCLGPPVNLAARLMSAAPGGTIHGTHEMVQATEGVFRWHSVGLREVKGVGQPVEVFALDAADDDRAPSRPLVGRAAELGTLTTAMFATRTGPAGVVAVQGEAGYGKSHLVATAASQASASGALVATGEAALANRRGSYHLWHNVFRDLLELGHSEQQPSAADLAAALGAFLPADVDRAPLLGPLLGITLPDSPLTAAMDAKLRKASREDLACRLLSTVSARHPLVLVLEDADRADPLSRGLIQEVARACATDPLCLVVTTRLTDTMVGAGDSGDGAVALSGATTTWIRLDPLPESDATALLRARLKDVFGTAITIPDDLVARLRERSQGNPFYIEQLVGFLATKGIGLTDPMAWREVELPASVHSLVLEKLDTLPEGPRRAVKVASIFGRHFHHAMLPAAYPELGAPHAVRQDLSAAVTADLVERDPDGTWAWRFRHAVVQEVAYESVPFALRTRMHGSIAGALEAADPHPVGDDLDQITHHWWHSGNVDKQRDYLARAADAARERYANETAIEYYERLVGLTSGVEQARALRGLGQVRELTGAWEDAQKAYSRAIALADADPLLQAWSRTHLADAIRRQGHFAEAQQALTLAEDAFTAAHDAGGRAQVLHLRGTLAAQQGDNKQARRHYEASLVLRPHDEEAARASTLSNLGVVAEYDGDLEAARQYHEQALALREERGDLWAISVSKTGLGMISMLQHNPERARRDFEEAMRLGVAVGDAWMVAISHNNLGNADRDLGEHTAAMAHYAAAAQRYAHSDDLWSLAFLLEDAAVCRATEKAAQGAALLLGAADRCRADLGSPRPESLESELTTRLEPVIHLLGLRDWRVAREAGRRVAPTDATSLLEDVQSTG